MTIMFYGSVLDQTGGNKSLELENTKTVSALIDALAGLYGESFKKYLLGDDTCFFLVNGKSILATGGLDTPLGQDAKIEILPVAEAG